MWILWLAGCFGDTIDQFNEAKEKIEGLTDPVVLQGFVLGVKEPTDPTIQELIEGSDFAPGVGAQIFLADATNADELDNAVSSALVQIQGSIDIILPEEPEVAGMYQVYPDEGLQYETGARWKVLAEVDPDEALSVARFTLPESAAGIDVPARHDPLTDLVLDFSTLPTEYDGSLVVVVNEVGEVTYTNEPEDIEDVYSQYLNDEPVTTVTIPGDAFPEQAIYAIGIAGMQKTDADNDLDEVNTALSAVVAGEIVFKPVTTLQFGQ